MSEQKAFKHEFADAEEAWEALKDCKNWQLPQRAFWSKIPEELKELISRARAAHEWFDAAVTFAKERGWPDKPMMTRREVLEAVANKEQLRARHPNPTTANDISAFEYQLACLNAARVHTPMVPIWGVGGTSETRVSRAIHELALLMNAEAGGDPV